MLERFSFARLLAVILVLSFILGFAAFVVSGATTNKGTTGAIASEYQLIMAAEKTACVRFGTYGSLASLQRERLLDFKPVYNSVVFLPGKHCGTVIIGSASYQSPAG